MTSTFDFANNMHYTNLYTTMSNDPILEIIQNNPFNIKVPDEIKKTPESYKAFMKGLSEGKYDSWTLPGNYLPNYDDEGIQVSFMSQTLVDKAIDNDIQWDQVPGYLPLADLEDQSGFLVSNISTEECPVYYWEQDDGSFHQIFPTLNAFLEKLEQ